MVRKSDHHHLNEIFKFSPDWLDAWWLYSVGSGLFIMREIKFRGKDCNGKWVYGDLRQQPNDEYCPVGIYQNDPEDWRGLPPVDPDTVGQFIGITDESGNEVYEGDILEADYKYDRLGYNGGVDPDNDCFCKGVVEFDNDTLQWVLNVHKADYPISESIKENECPLVPLHIFGHEYGYDNSNIKVLGNIHDNPDLLK